MEYTLRGFSERTKEVLDWLRGEYAVIQPGAAVPSMVDFVTVSAYGAETPLRHCAKHHVGEYAGHW